MKALAASTGWTRERLAWMAALLEGEGCVGDDPLRVTLKMCDRDVLERFQEYSGFHTAVGGPYPPSGLGKKDTYSWQVSGRKAYALLVALWPWLGVRRQTRIVHATQKHCEGGKQYRCLTPMQVRDIKQRMLSPRWGLMRELAKEYNVTDGMIGHIRSGRAWGHIEAAS